MSPFYPADYYSFADDQKNTLISKVKWWLRTTRNRYYKTARGFTGKIIHAVLPNTAIQLFYTLKPDKSWSIVDVGCGNEALFLSHLADEGYCHFLGIDPFLPHLERRIGNGKIIRKSIQELDGKFDLITFNHSFEHVPDQLQTLRKSASLLAPEGTLMIRIPTVSSMAWHNHREYWANLDAPRHLFLHSLKSMAILGKKCGLEITTTVYDSNGFQFWGYELFKRNIPLGGTVSTRVTLIRLFFRFFYSIIKYPQICKLNASGKGDTIAIFFRHVPTPKKD